MIKHNPVKLSVWDDGAWLLAYVQIVAYTFASVWFIQQEQSKEIPYSQMSRVFMDVKKKYI